MKDLISVIIPVYNRQDVIEECINSVFAQSYQNFEIVIVDDGSIDNTIKICEALAEKDSRIKLFVSEHGGVSKARNKAIEESSGEYIFFLDSDDVIHPQLLETLLLGMKSSDAAISGTRITNVHEKYWNMVKEKIAEDNGAGETEYKSFNDTLHAVFNTDSPLNLIGGVMMQRDLIADTRFRTDLFIGEDFYFIYENLIKGANSVFLKQKWYYCRIHQNNSSNNFNFSAFWTRFYRRVLVWQSEEAFGRSEYAKCQKISAIGIYMKCILMNKPSSKDAKEIRKVFKSYKNEILTALSFKFKTHYYLCLYIPFTYSKILNLRNKLRRR